jgi:hypothetical protein
MTSWFSLLLIAFVYTGFVLKCVNATSRHPVYSKQLKLFFYKLDRNRKCLLHDFVFILGVLSKAHFWFCFFKDNRNVNFTEFESLLTDPTLQDELLNLTLKLANRFHNYYHYTYPTDNGNYIDSIPHAVNRTMTNTNISNESAIILSMVQDLQWKTRLSINCSNRNGFAAVPMLVVLLVLLFELLAI